MRVNIAIQERFVAGAGYTLEQYTNDVLAPSARDTMLYNKYKILYLGPAVDGEDAAAREARFAAHVDELVRGAAVVYANAASPS